MRMKPRSARSLWWLRGGIVGGLLLLILYFNLTVPLKIALPLTLGVGIFVYIIVRSNARVTHYTCIHCSVQFKISPWTDFCSPHRPECKLLQCPNCGEIDWHQAG